MEESDLEPSQTQEDECVICVTSRATMKTMPCKSKWSTTRNLKSLANIFVFFRSFISSGGHQVVCRRCFVKTIQSAVAQRLLPLRCVICRERINRLTSSSGTFRLQESASSYSVGCKSWSVSWNKSIQQWCHSTIKLIILS